MPGYLYKRNPLYQGNVAVHSSKDLSEISKATDRFLDEIGAEKMYLGETFRISERNKAIAEYKKQLQEYEDIKNPPIEDEEENKYRTPEEKREYISLLNQRVENLKQYQKDVSKEDYIPRISGEGMTENFLFGHLSKKGKRIADINKEIVDITEQIRNIEHELSPITQDEIDEIMKTFDIEDPYEKSKSFSQKRKEYGSRYERIMREGFKKRDDELRAEIYGLNIAENILTWDELQSQANDTNFKLDNELLTRTKKDLLDLGQKNGFLGFDEKYREADYTKKRKEILRKADQYANEGTNTDGTPLSKEEKEKRKQNYLKHIIHPFTHDDFGDMKIEGAKLMIEKQRNMALELLSAYKAELSKIEHSEKYKDIRKEAQPDNFQVTRYRDPIGDIMAKTEGLVKMGENLPAELSEYAGYLVKEISMLESAITKYNNILKMPEIRGGISDFILGKGARKGVDYEDIGTLGLKAMFETADLLKISNKLTDGDELTLAEENYLKTYATLNFISSKYKPEGIWYQAQKGIIDMIPYIVTFVLTGGTYSTARKTIYETVKQQAKKGLGQATVSKIVTKGTVKFAGEKYVMADIAAKNVARLGASAYQTLFNPQMYLRNIAEELAGIPEIEADEYGNVIATIDKNTKEELLPGIYKGSIDAFGEILMERSGAYLMKGPSALKKAFGSTKFGEKAMKSAVLKRMTQLKGYTTVKKLNEEWIKKEMGWHGIMEEYLEELATHYFTSVAKGEKVHGEGFWEEQLVTFLTVGLFGKLTNVGKWGTEKIVGTDVRFDYSDPATGKRGSIKLPLHVYEELNKIFEGKRIIDGKKINELLEKYKEKLSKEQIKLIINLAFVNGRKKTEKMAYERAKVGEPQEDIVTTITREVTEEEFDEEHEVLTPEEKRNVRKANTRVIKRNKALADLGLLLVDEVSGQYLEPTKTQIKAQLRSTNDQISNIDLSKEENKVSKNPDVALLFKRQAALTNWLNMYAELDITEWDTKSASRQHEALTAELERGELLKGKASKKYGGRTGLLVTLSDGRVVRAYVKPNMSKADQKDLVDAIVDNKDFELEVEGWESWNPERTILDEKGLPYEHRININITNKKGEKVTVGTVRVTDDFAAKKKAASKKVKTDKANDFAINTLNSEIKKRNLQTPLKRKFVSQKPVEDIDLEETESAESEKDIERTSESQMYKQQEEVYYDENFGLEHIEAVDTLESFMQQNGFEYDKKYSFNEINDKLIDKVKEPFVHAILSALCEFINTMQTDIVFVNRYRYNKKGELEGCAEYDHIDNKIVMYIPAIARKYVLNRNMEGEKLTIKGKTHVIGVSSVEHMMQKVFGHEVVHAFTLGRMILYEGETSKDPLWKMIVSNKGVSLQEWERQACENIQFIYDFIKDKHPELSTEYGIKNVRELVAEAMSNAGFAVKLQNITLPQHLQYKPQTKNVLSALAEIIKDFINNFMKAFGMKEKSANNAFEAISSFINDLARTYNPTEHLLSSVTFAYYWEVRGNIERTAMQDIDNVTDESRKNIQESLYAAIDSYTKFSEMSAENTIPIVRSWIKKAENLSDYEKAIWNMVLDRNADLIIKHAITRTLARKGLLKKEKIVEPSDLDIPDLDLFIMTGKQKVEAITNILARFWEAIAQNTGKDKDVVIHTFYKLAKEPLFKEMVSDDATFKEYLNSIRGRDDITEAFIEIFDKSKLDDILSLFLFYGDMSLTRYYGLTIRDKELSWDLLNPSEKYSEFINRFLVSIDHKGTEGIRSEIVEHNARRIKRFQIQNNSYSAYEKMTPEERYRLRLEQHENDLDLLSNITGLDKELWRQYFVKRTNETKALSSKDATNIAEFGTYDNLLKYDTFRAGYKNKVYHRIQSNLMFQLSLLPAKEDFKSALIKFFTEGDPESNVYSNLYKLSTAIVDRDDIGLSGIDVKGDRITSFIQTSHMQVTAENIQKLGLTNKITEFYLNERRTPEIIIFNGIRNVGKDVAKDSIESGELSSRNFWKSMLWLFMKGSELGNSKSTQNTYLQWLGQFGDKSNIAVMEVPKYKPTEEDIYKKRREHKDFDKIVNWMYKDQLINQSAFKDYTNGNLEKLKELIRQYVYNFIENIIPLNQLFHGDLVSYKSFTDLVKRAATTNSPGYRPMTNIANGLGEEYRFAVAEDTFGIIDKGFDGIEFMTGEYAAAMQVSMGNMFGKKERYPVLSGVKGLTSFTDPQTNLRGNTKVNLLNIDVYCDSHPEGSVYHQIRNVMKQYGIDRLAFVSGNKKYESPYGEKAVIDLFEDRNNIKKNLVIPKDGDKVIGIVTRNHQNFFIQQDLRHETKPKEAKMSSQLLANVLHFPHGHQISNLYNQIQQTAISELIAEIEGKITLESKLEWLRESINPYTQKDIAQLLDMGLTIHDPFLRTYFNRMIASAFTHKALEISVNRIATQEIADFAGVLQGRKLSPSNSKHILLPDIATTIDGGRYHDNQFVEKNKGNTEKAISEAIAHVERNKDKYRDLYDENGMLMEYEIIDRDGIIPGEIVISIRTPNDDLHSMTVGRLSFPIAHGNFTMLDNESQRISGSDFDGDQRFNIVLYKDGRSILTDQTRRGLVNKMIMSIVYDYSNPKVDARIKAPIDVMIYDPILESIKKTEIDYSDQFDNILGFDKARNENLVAARLKGKLTDLNTIYKILSEKKIKLKEKILLSIHEDISEYDLIWDYAIEEIPEHIEFNKLPYNSNVKTMTYAGIGSRNTPAEIKKQMTEFAKEAETLGYTLNTGVSFNGKKEGADEAFDIGVKDRNKINLFAPENVEEREIKIAKEIHPNPVALNPGELKLMARNTNQVFGKDLNTPVDFVLFWAEETSNPLRPKGGTGQAVEMARRKNIPTINMADPNWRKQADQVISGKKRIEKEKTQSQQIYEQLGDKTKSENVRIESWQSLENAKEPFSKIYGIIAHVISTRIYNSKKHFGNPFSNDKKVLAKNPELIKTSSTRESVEKYIDWILNSDEARAKWIREIVSSGELKEKPILYYKELGEPSHATALDYLINKYDWEGEEQPIKEEEKFEKKQQLQQKLAIVLSELSNDKYGIMSAHVSNILNIAFDNMADPRIERMGLNEHTVDMWMTALIFNPKLHAYNYKNAEQHNKAIIDYVEDLIEYFRQPVLSEFTSLMRNGYTTREVKEQLLDSYDETFVNELINFYYKSQDLARLRRIYSLTQKMLETTSEFIYAKNDYKALKDNKFDLIDTRAFFNSKGKISNEFKIIESVIDIVEEFVISDNFENTLIGNQILRAIIIRLQDKKGRIKKDQLDSVIYGINNVAAIRAMNLGVSIPVLENVIRASLDSTEKNGLRQRYPENKFLKYIIVTKNGKIEINQEFKWAKFTDQQLEEIRNDFDALPDETKKDFAMYALANWGIHTSSFQGSYAKLIGNQYRVYISEKVSEEFIKWFNDDMTSAEKYQIMQTVLRGSRIENVREKAEINERFDGAYEYNILANVGKQDFPISLDSLEGIEKTNFEDYEQFANYASEKGFDARLFVDFAMKEYGKAKVLSYAGKLLSEFRNKADQVFPRNNRSKDEIKNMMSVDVVGEALATEDPALESFILEKLKEMYPGVLIFTDRQAFYDFVQLNGGRNQDVSFSAIGHAFKNAVFIDPNKAVQSTTIHEHSHIYWDALPDDNKAKERLREVVAKNFPELADEFESIEKLDEFIIVQIGHAGVDIARIDLKKGLIGEFMNALKQFWIEVKKLLGLATQKDLIFSMAMDIWNNKEKINPQTIPGQAYIRNMISYDAQMYNDYRDAKEKKENFYINNIPVPGVTSVISKIAPEIFDADKIAAESVGRWDFMRRAITRHKLTTEELNAEQERITKIWKKHAETGTILHAMLQYFADIGTMHPSPKPNINPQNVTNWFANWDAYSQFFTDADRYINNLKEMYSDGIFHTEKLLISKKFGIAGYADLVIELPGNKLIIIDFKSTDREFVDASPEAELRNYYKQSFGKMSAPFRFNNSKFNRHSLQLNMYGLMAEEQEDIDNPGQRNTVQALRIIPIVRTVNDEGKIESATIGSFVNIPNNENFRRNAENVMAYHSIKAKSVNESNDYREQLERQSLAPQAIDGMVEAYKYLLSKYGDPRKVTLPELAQYCSDMRNSVDGYRQMMHNLVNRGFTMEDFDNIPLEHLFYIAFHETGIKRNGYDDAKDELFPEFEVGKRFKPVKNLEKPKRIWSHLQIDNQDCYLKEIGLREIAVNDEILMVYDFTDALGKPRRETYFYTVISVDRKGRIVSAVDPDTKEVVKLKAYHSIYGFYKVYDVMPKGYTIPKKNSYVPRYIYEVDVIKERHYKDFMTEEQYMENVKDKYYSVYRSNMKRIWNFFKQVPMMDDLNWLMQDSEGIAEWLQSFDTVDETTLGRLGLFLQDENVNHWMAQQLKREHDQFQNVPSQPLPFTFLFHQMFLSGRSLDSFFSQDFSFLSGLWGWLPPEFLDISNTALSTFYQSASESFGLYTEVKFNLEYDFKKFADKVNMDMIIVGGPAGILWRVPSEVQEGTLEREFLDKIYEYHKKYDVDFRKQEEAGISGRIPVSYVYMSYEEFIRRYGKWGRIMYQKLKPTAFDHIRLMITLEDGTETLKTLRDIKDSFIFNKSTPEQARDFFGDKVFQLLKPGTTQSLISIKAGQLDRYIKEAKAIYKKGWNEYNSESYMRKRRRSIRIIGSRRMAYRTDDFIRAEEKAIESHIFKYFMGSQAGALAWMDQLYDKNNAENENRVHRYLKGWGNYLLFGETTDFRGNLAVKEVMDALIVLNSRNKIAFSIPTQIINLAVGQTMDIVMEPGAYIKGWKRLVTRDKQGVWGWEKAFKILKKHGLADIINDHAYKKLEEQMKFLNVSAQAIADSGYWLMSFAEELNQFSVFVGLMTQAEWNAYDGNAESIDPNNKLTWERKKRIAHRVRFIHGMYGKISTAPMWNNIYGKAILQFRKWLPPLIWNQLAPYYIDQTFFERSGILPSIWSSFKMLQYNLSPVSVKQKRLAKAIEEQFSKAKNESNKMRIKNTRDHINSQLLYANGIKDLGKYVKVLAAELEAGRVSWKQFSLNDRKNLMIAARFIGTVALRYMVLAIAYGREEEKGYMKAGMRTFVPFFTRFSNDILWIYSWENWNELKESPMPLLALIINSGEFLIDLVTLEKYEKDSIYGYRGLAKAAVSWTYVTPYGSAIRSMWRWGLMQSKKLRRADIYDIWDELPSNLQQLLLTKDFSQYEVLEMAHRARKAFPMLKKGLTAIELEKAGVSLKDYAVMQQYTKNQRKILQETSDMIKLFTLEDLGYIKGYELKDVMKKGRELSESEAKARVTREKDIKKQLDRINKQ